jgi:hypothetical protein
LTLDETAVMQSLDAIGTSNIPKQGTSLAEPIAEARKAFASSGENKRCLVIFTEARTLKATVSPKPRNEGLIIVTVGTGTVVQGAPVPVSEEEGRLWLLYKGRFGRFRDKPPRFRRSRIRRLGANGLYGNSHLPRTVPLSSRN